MIIPMDRKNQIRFNYIESDMGQIFIEVMKTLKPNRFIFMYYEETEES